MVIEDSFNLKKMYNNPCIIDAQLNCEIVIYFLSVINFYLKKARIKLKKKTHSSSGPAPLSRSLVFVALLCQTYLYASIFTKL